MKIRVVILFPSVFPTQTSFINSRFKTSTVFVFNFIALPKFGSEVDKLIVIFFNYEYASFSFFFALF